jgi:toxin YoeB
LGVRWKIVYTKQALKDAKNLKASRLEAKAKTLLNILEENPYNTTPPFKKMVGILKGTCTRRINIQHRLIYQVYDNEKTVKIIRMWTHYT